jgi:hypothetical protein
MSTFNGRVNIKSPNTSDLFKMYDKIPAHQCSTFRNPTEGIWNETILSAIYFSSDNIQVIQNGIRAGVYKRSNGQYLIGPQDCDTLKVIMRSIFLQYSANKPSNIKEQVSELNKLVLNFCIQQVYSEAQGYMNYINDVSTLVIPLSNPIMPDNTDRQLEFKHWF